MTKTEDGNEKNRTDLSRFELFTRFFETGEKTSACLIAEVGGKNASFGLFRPSGIDYYEHLKNRTNGTVLSVDMVRLALRFTKAQGERMSEIADTFGPRLNLRSFTSKIRPGGWWTLRTWDVGESSITFGHGFMSKSCKVDLCRGFVEFNPNKVAQSDEFWEVFRKIVGDGTTQRKLVRFDLAMDTPSPRNEFRFVKDHRKYECVISNGMTEYLGCRSSDGYSKLYDKKAESDLSEEVTRTELTCAGDWSAHKIIEKWPEVVTWSGAPGSGSPLLQAMAVLLAELQKQGGIVETHLHTLDKKTRRRLIKLGTVRSKPPTICEAAAMIEIAKSWETRISK